MSSVASMPSEALMTGVTESEKDFIISTVTEILEMGEQEVLSRVQGSAETVEVNYFWLGGLLARIKDDGLWKSAEGDYESFADYVHGTFGFRTRKADYLISNFKGLVNSEVPWSKVGKIGWSKIKEIIPVLTKDNVDEWVSKAVLMTLLQLQEAVAAAKSGTLNKSDQTPDTPDVTSINFKVHADQKETIQSAVDKAKGEAETEFPGVALEAICMSYLAGGGVTKPAGLLATMKKHTIEEVIEAIEAIWPDVDIMMGVPE